MIKKEITKKETVKKTEGVTKKTPPKLSLAEKKQAYILALEKTYGNLTHACKLCKISRQTPYLWAEKDSEFSRKIHSTEYKEIQLDEIEYLLMRQAKMDNTAVLIFLAKTLGKSRGYVEKIETENINHNMNKTIEIKFVDEDDSTKDDELTTFENTPIEKAQNEIDKYTNENN